MGRRQESGTGRGSLFRADDRPRHRTHPLVRPAFSPKFLYFAQGSTIEPRYVILDAVVAGNQSQGGLAGGGVRGMVPGDIRALL